MDTQAEREGGSEASEWSLEGVEVVWRYRRPDGAATSVRKVWDPSMLPEGLARPEDTPASSPRSEAETESVVEVSGLEVSGLEVSGLEHSGESRGFRLEDTDPPGVSASEVLAAAGVGRGGVREFSEGTRLGAYRIVEPIGRGGMGVVYRAHDESLDRSVALKVLSPDLSRNGQFIERFQREAKSCARLSHPNITVIYARSEEGAEHHWFAMEFVEGRNLADRVKRDGPLDPGEVLEIGRQSAQGLKAAALHKIIHRDIKPSNVLWMPDGQVKITDFGLAKARAAMGHTLDLTSTGVVMGTPLFMSPEQGRGATVDHRSDQYSLGATLFYLLYGCPPFEAETPIAIILKHLNDPVQFPERDVPQPLRAVISRMLAKDVGRRFQDYESLLAALDRAERGEAPAEEGSRRVFVLQPADRAKARGTFKTGRLSVARTNVKLGRRDKAISLLSEALTEGDSQLRAEAALLLMELHEGAEEWERVRELAEVVLAESSDPSHTAFAAWKLADLDEREALERARRALAHYTAILERPPEALPREVLEAQIRRLKAQIAASEREQGSTQVLLGR